MSSPTHLLELSLGFIEVNLSLFQPCLGLTAQSQVSTHLCYLEPSAKMFTSTTWKWL